MLTRIAIPEHALPVYAEPAYALPGSGGITVSGGPYELPVPTSNGTPVGTPSASGGTAPYNWTVVSETLL
jgi:hypothetical protein